MTQLANLDVWLINLPRSTDRLAKMESQLAAMGIQYRKFDAIDGKADWDRLEKTVDRKAFARNVGRDVIPAEIGCYHSHLDIWQNIAGGQADIALVLEDDVVFGHDFVAAVEAAVQNADHWDIVKLNKIRAKMPVKQADLGQWQLNAYIGPLTGMGAYLIKRDAAPRLLSQMLPITRPIDHEIDRPYVHDIRHFGLEPFPSHVDDEGQSTITGTEFAIVQKPKWYKRLPYYRLKATNYFRRTFWLVKNGRL